MWWNGGLIFFSSKIICHYGSTCKTFNCPYVHPNNPNQIPHPSQLKWSSEMGGIGGGGHDNLIIKQKQRKQPIEIWNRKKNQPTFGCWFISFYFFYSEKKNTFNIIIIFIVYL